MGKKYQIILAVLLIATITGAIISLFQPYLVKLNIRSGDLSLPKMYLGTHYGLTKFIVLMMMGSIISLIKSKRQFITLLLSAFAIGLTYLVRLSIHSQGFIDHDYDSKTGTGTGFMLLFITVMAHFIISLIAFILQKSIHKEAATNNN